MLTHINALRHAMTRRARKRRALDRLFILPDADREPALFGSDLADLAVGIVLLAAFFYGVLA